MAAEDALSLSTNQSTSIPVRAAAYIDVAIEIGSASRNMMCVFRFGQASKASSADGDRTRDAGQTLYWPRRQLAKHSQAKLNGCLQHRCHQYVHVMVLSLYQGMSDARNSLLLSKVAARPI